MSQEYSPETGTPSDCKTCAFIPIALLAISFIVLLGWQVGNTSTQRGLLQSAISRQESSVTQANQVKANLAKLAGDLLQTAQTDDTAKAIATKFGIRGNAPAASPAP